MPRQQDEPTAEQQMEARERAQTGALNQRRMQQQQEIAQERFAIEAGRQELDSIHQMSELEKERIKIKDSLQKQKDRVAAFKGLSDIKPDDPEMDTKISTLLHDNPAAADDPTIRSALTHRYQQALVMQTERNRQMNDGLDFAKTHGINLIMQKDNPSLPDFDAMREAAKANMQPIPAGFKPQEVTISSTGAETQRLGPDKTRQSQTATDEIATATGELARFNAEKLALLNKEPKSDTSAQDAQISGLKAKLAVLKQAAIQAPAQTTDVPAQTDKKPLSDIFGGQAAQPVTQ